MPIRALVLTGTALGPWWLATKFSALPGPHLFFYHCFGGALFAQKGVRKKHRSAFMKNVAPALSTADLPTRMRKTAQGLHIPRRLVQSITCPIFLVWGKSDRWYPSPVAKAIARTAQAPIFWVSGGHYCMWESPKEFDRILQHIEGLLS